MADCGPKHGFTQPALGRASHLSLCEMRKASNPRSPKSVSAEAKRAKQIWSENVKAVMAARFPIAKYRNTTGQEDALAALAKCSGSSIQRASDPEKNFGIGLDQLADIAHALEVPISDLFRNGYAATLYAAPVDDPKDELQRPSNRRPPGKPTPEE